jgi:hypothetical protein
VSAQSEDQLLCGDLSLELVASTREFDHTEKTRLFRNCEASESSLRPNLFATLEAYKAHIVAVRFALTETVYFNDGRFDQAGDILGPLAMKSMNLCVP